MKVWIPIPGHEGYFLTKSGDIGTQWVNKGMHGLIKESNIKILKCSKTKVKNKLYKTVFLGGRKGRRVSLHRLMYETFVGDIPEGLVVRHLNDNSLDNNLKNLEVGTQKDNMNDCKRNGNIVVPMKLTARDKVEIKNIKAKCPETPNKEIAEIFNVSRRTIDRVLKNEYGYQARREQRA